MSEKDGGPAFPTEMAMRVEDRVGMTLRDYFAAKALDRSIELAREAALAKGIKDEEVSMCAAVAAYEFADAMLKERTK